jgi:hypothetical protein
MIIQVDSKLDQIVKHMNRYPDMNISINVEWFDRRSWAWFISRASSQLFVINAIPLGGTP